MTAGDRSRHDPAAGARTDATGTPYPVPPTRDRAAWVSLIVFLAGPVIWFAHFILVYAVAEAGCTGGGHGLRAFDPPVPATFTLVATAVAAIASLGTAAWGYRRWRRDADGAGDDDGHGPLAFGGLLLSLLSFLTVLGVGVNALFFGGC